MPEPLYRDDPSARSLRHHSGRLQRRHVGADRGRGARRGSDGWLRSDRLPPDMQWVRDGIDDPRELRRVRRLAGNPSRERSDRRPHDPRRHRRFGPAARRPTGALRCSPSAHEGDLSVDQLHRRGRRDVRLLDRRRRLHDMLLTQDAHRPRRRPAQPGRQTDRRRRQHLNRQHRILDC